MMECNNQPRSGGGIFVTARVQERVDKCIPTHLHSPPPPHQTVRRLWRGGGGGGGDGGGCGEGEERSGVGGGLQRCELVASTNNIII